MKVGLRRQTPGFTLGVATLASTLGALPVWLTGALAVFIGAELGFGAAQQGAAVSVYFAAASLTSGFAGVLAEHLGARRAVTVAIGMAMLSLAGIATVATAWWHLVPFLAIAGAGSAIMQPATNLALARGVPLGRLGISFGLKQASIPFATLLAGVAVPALGVTVGWRAAFLVAGLTMLAFALTIPVLPSVTPGQRPQRRAWNQVRPSLLVLTAGAACGVAAATAMSAFAVTSGIERGLTPGGAGLALALGSGLSGVVRIIVGWFADRRGSSHLPRVAGMLVLGAFGAAVVALAPTGVPFVFGILLMYGAGWGWNGLFIFSVVRQYPTIPAVATGVSQVGIRAGGVLGPLGFGIITEQASDVPAWLSVAASLAIGGGLIVLGRRMLLRERRGATITSTGSLEDPDPDKERS